MQTWNTHPCRKVVSCGEVFEAKQAVPMAGSSSAGVNVDNLKHTGQDERLQINSVLHDIVLTSE